MEPLSRRGQEPTLKDDNDPLALSPAAPTTGPSRRGRPPRRPNAYPSAPVLRVVGGVDGGAEGPEGAEGAEEASYSQQNGLLAINMLLFEVSRFAPRAAAQPRAPYPTPSMPRHTAHTASSLAEAVRRGGGRVPLLLLCTLYMGVAHRLGLGLRLVTIRDEVQQLRMARGMARGKAPPAADDDPTYNEPTYLLQLPGTADQRELYVDVRAEGRLRSTHDLAAFLHPSLRALPSDKIREFVTPLSHETYCVQATPWLGLRVRGRGRVRVLDLLRAGNSPPLHTHTLTLTAPALTLAAQLLRELEDTAADSGSLAEAAFWRVQQEVLIKQQQLWQQQQQLFDELFDEGGEGGEEGEEGRNAAEA